MLNILSKLTYIFLISIFIFPSNCNSLKILIGNDDSWGTANIRALYYTAKRKGHQVIIAAPANQMSGTNGLRKPSTKLYKNSKFDLIKAGSPAEGKDEKDDQIWYINSTPASSIEFGLNVLCPRFFGSDPDLVITGVNQGSNLGLSYLGSGTFGAAKYAVKSKNIPSIAFSANNHLERKYTELNQDDKNDQANVYASMAMDLIDKLIRNKKDNDNLLPSGTLLNVNFPDQTKLHCQSSNSTWILTRILASLDKTPDTCTDCEGNKLEDQCKLPTESSLFKHSNHGCTNSISVAVSNLNPDATPEQQNSVYESLGNLLSCPASIHSSSPSLSFQN